MPVNDAIAPMTGPSNAPKSAAPIALPISRPRELAGVSATSHASAAVHEHELANPCRKRAPSSIHTLVAKPNSAVVTTMPRMPVSTTVFTPNQDVASPAGIPPTSAPTAYVAASAPAPDFERPNSSA